jgi:hypothetical protein
MLFVAAAPTSAGAAPFDECGDGLGQGPHRKTHASYHFEMPKVIESIRQVRDQRRRQHLPMELIDRLNVIDQGYRRYIETYSATLDPVSGVAFRRVFGHPLTLEQKAEYLGKIFPETTDEEMEDVLQVAADIFEDLHGRR